jgi:O-antigen ligase
MLLLDNQNEFIGMKYNGLLVLLYIFFASWTNAFALNDWAPIYIIILFASFIFALPIAILKEKELKLIYRSEDLFLIMFFFVILFFAFLNPTPKSLNYIAAYFITIFINYFFIRNYILQKLDLKHVLKVNVLGVFFVSLFCNLEFLLSFVYGIYIQDFIPRTMIANADYMLGIRRVYAFSEEPTYLAWYFETLGLIAIWTVFVIYKNSYFRYFFITSFIIAFISTFSAAGFGTLILSFLFVFMFKLKKKIRSVLIIMLLLIVSYYIYNYYYDYVEVIVSKLTLNQVGSGHRKDLWLTAFNDYLKNPFLGSGLGSYSSRGVESPVNYFLFLISENGILPLFLLMFFYSQILWKVYKSNFPRSFIFLIAIMSGILHLFTQSLFFHPCLWLSIIIFYKFQSNITVPE